MMNCTCAQVSVTGSAFPDGLFVVVERARVDGIIGDDDSSGPPLSPLSVRATDCDRCWSAPEVHKPDTTQIKTWLDEVACALAGGKGKDEEEETANAALTSLACSRSTFPGARGLSHSVSAELNARDGRLDLLVSWTNRANGNTERARLSLQRVSPEDAELAARRGIIALALASARAVGAAAAELAAQNAELAEMAERAQASATGAESRARAREGELFAKFAAVLNEKKAEAAKWRQLAEGGTGGAGGGAAGKAAAAAPMSLAAAADGARQGRGRAPAASGAANGAAEGGGGEEPMLTEGAPASAAAAAADATTEDEEDDRRPDSGGSRSADEGFDDDDDDDF